MSLYGALFSGVSGLSANSSALSAISDNITNVNTTGYKETKVDFATLVTKQTTATYYSSGGVMSQPQQLVNVQGLLEASSSSTDLAISGNGFFVVSSSPTPGDGDQFMFTRSGSFSIDEDGYLVNSSGYYLMGWPLDSSGDVIPADSSLSVANQNIISNDYLSAINLETIAGTASATTTIAMGANLPSTAEEYDSTIADPEDQDGYQTIDVEFYDTLGNSNTLTFEYLKTDQPNEWDINVEPPTGTTHVALYDSSGNVYDTVGQLEFTAVPQAGETITIGGETYSFLSTSGGTYTGADNQIDVDGASIADIVSDLVTQINTDDATYQRASIKDGTTSTLILDQAEGAGSLAISGIQNLTDGSGNQATKQGLATDTFTLEAITVTDAAITFLETGVPGEINVSEMAVFNFSNGAGDMNNTDLDADGITDVERIAIDLGTVGGSDGFTQLGETYTAGFINQDGAQFGTFSGVTISEDGVVTAQFDNGELRAIYQLPLATFTNANGLEALTGNVWIATDESGDYVLREASSGTAGEITQGSLEASTVDLGEQFSKMIVVQQAYNASSKVITTASDMMDELMRIVR